MNTKRVFCDVLTGRDPAAGIVIVFPPHVGDVKLTFLHKFTRFEDRAQRPYDEFSPGEF